MTAKHILANENRTLTFSAVYILPHTSVTYEIQPSLGMWREQYLDHNAFYLYGMPVKRDCVSL